MKSTIDIIDIINRMASGEEVIENYNSEKTAKAEMNRIVKFVNDNSFDILFYLGQNKTVDEKRTNYEFYMQPKKVWTGISFDEAYPHIEQLVLSGILRKKIVGDSISVDMAKRTGKEPRHSFFFGSRNNPSSGKYVATCVAKTNTSKQRTIGQYHEKMRELKNMMGLFSSAYIPIRNTTIHSIELDYEDKIARIEELMSKPLPQCTPKQADWIRNKLGSVNSNKLNKFQASELLDVLFNGPDNKAASNPDDVIAHYTRILSENRIRRMIDECVVRTINEEMGVLDKEWFDLAEYIFGRCINNRRKPDRYGAVTFTVPARQFAKYDTYGITGAKLNVEIDGHMRSSDGCYSRWRGIPTITIARAMLNEVESGWMTEAEAVSKIAHELAHLVNDKDGRLSTRKQKLSPVDGLIGSGAHKDIAYLFKETEMNARINEAYAYLKRFDWSEEIALNGNERTIEFMRGECENIVQLKEMAKLMKMFWNDRGWYGGYIQSRSEHEKGKAYNPNLSVLGGLKVNGKMPEDNLSPTMYLDRKVKIYRFLEKTYDNYKKRVYKMLYKLLSEYS